MYIKEREREREREREMLTGANTLSTLLAIYSRESSKTKTSLNKIKITTYFENRTIELLVLYALNTHVKFCVNRILFTI